MKNKKKIEKGELQETLIFQGFRELEKDGKSIFADSGRRGRRFKSCHSDFFCEIPESL